MFAPSAAGSAKSPDCETVIDTARSVAGAGVARTVNEAAEPSVTAPAAEIDISGSDSGGSPASVSSTVTAMLALPPAPSVADTVT